MNVSLNELRSHGVKALEYANQTNHCPGIAPPVGNSDSYMGEAAVQGHVTYGSILPPAARSWESLTGLMFLYCFCELTAQQSQEKSVS